MLRNKKAPLLELGDELCQDSIFFNFVILFAEFINKDGARRARNCVVNYQIVILMCTENKSHVNKERADQSYFEGH